ncbi:cytochrome b/b6 domain-containing protein [Pokkaliibacter sp. CJK22405]|uniref:cytochrome b/b6 domain-containing protein n=1 Tax=Pokkaliibacter sp. CJK22405 TaxID=3384615 RepID=UPI0039852B99
MEQQRQRITVWDWGVRLFHWLLVLDFAGLWYTAEQGMMLWHERCGYLMFGLLLFRWGWGIWGSSTAKLSVLITSPSKVVNFLKSLVQRKTHAEQTVGHNPAGGWMVLVLLLVLSLQVMTGMMGNDDVFFTGPLAGWVDKDTSDLLTRIHHIAFNGLLWLAGIHIAAVLWHQFTGERLIEAMISGKKRLAHVAAPSLRKSPAIIVTVIIAVVLAYCIIHFAPTADY